MAMIRKLAFTILVFCLLFFAVDFALELNLVQVPMGHVIEERPLYSISEEGKDLPQAKQDSSPLQDEGALYEVIREALLEAVPEVDLSLFADNETGEAIFATVQKVVNENPEILYYDGAKYWANGKLEVYYKKDRETSLSHQRAVVRQVDAIAKNVVSAGMSDYEKVLAVHDYIIENARYDIENLSRGTLPPESSAAYGVLVQGMGVCESYAKAMKLVMDRLGITCLYVTGQADGEGHAWNIIKIGGDYYHMDLTWNDPVTSDGTDKIRYDYFNVTDAEISVSHSWDQTTFPPCTATRYNYHGYNDLVINTPKEFYEAIRRTLTNKEKDLTLKIPDFDPITYDVVKTVKKVVTENRGLSHKGFTYYLPDNKRIGIISIHFN